MAQYRTAQGRVIDMSALIAKNEKTRAVGNMKVNARGDTIDGSGRVVEPVTDKVSKRYSRTVGNRSALPTQKPQPKPQDTFDRDLQALEEEFNDDDAIEMEKLKEQEAKKSKKENK